MDKNLLWATEDLKACNRSWDFPECPFLSKDNDNTGQHVLPVFISCDPLLRAARS